MSATVCPICGGPLYSVGGSMVRCPRGHLFRAVARPAYQEKFCLPVLNWCFGSETVRCTILGFSFGDMPEYMCSGIKLVGLMGGIALGVYILKRFLKKEEGEREAVITVYD